MIQVYIAYDFKYQNIENITVDIGILEFLFEY